jgi:cytochrome c biogenesis protein CcmG, thiol:disulfide interchange protein DsbE
MALARKLRFVPPIVIGAGLVYLLTHDGGGGGGELRPPAKRKAVEMSFPALEGPRWSLAEERGKVVLVNFWATWCGPCREETPALVHLAEDYRASGVSVVGVSLDENSPHAVREFVKRYRMTYPVLMPPADSPVASSVSSLPTTLLIDRQGRVAKTYVGAVRGAVFRRDVDALLGEQP